MDNLTKQELEIIAYLLRNRSLKQGDERMIADEIIQRRHSVKLLENFRNTVEKLPPKD